MPPALSAILARNLAAERVRRRWSQAELAERLGVGRTTIGSWENGQRLIGVDLLVPLCLVFDVPLSVLLMGADEQQLRALGLPP